MTMLRTRYVACLALVALAAPPSDLALRVEEEAELTKTLEEETTWELESLLQSFGGAVVADEAPPMEAFYSRRLVVRDDYGPVDADGPVRLSRTFDEVSIVAEGNAEIEGSAFDFGVELSSDLVDETVVFQRDDEGDYDVSFEEGSGAANGLLQNHDVDMDLRGLLPEEEVGEGDTWTVEDDALRALLAMGGSPPMTVESLDGESQYLMPSDILAMGLAHLAESSQEVTGEAQLTWARTREADGARLAVLELEVEAETEAQLDELIRTLMAESGRSDDREELTLATAWSLDGKGLVEWDLEAGHFRQLSFEADVEVTVEMTWTQAFGGQELDFIGEYGLVGTTEITVAAEE